MDSERKPKNPYYDKLAEYRSHAWDQLSPEIPKGRWKQFFHSKIEKIVFEIGSSNAEFLCNVAKDHPEVGFVGVDWKFKVLYRGAKRIADQGIKNVALIRGLVQNCERFFDEGELDEIWIFFPDPWAKASQLKNRIMNEEQLEQLGRLLKKGGAIYFKTDHPGYFQWVLALLGQPTPVIDGYEPKSDRGVAEGHRSRRIKQVKVRLPMGSIKGDKPAVSLRLQEIYKVEEASQLPAPAFYNALFSSNKTLFEKVFEKEKLPTYGIVLRRK